MGGVRFTLDICQKKLESARKRLSVLFNRSDHKAIVERKKILKEMDELLLKDEIMWKQRSCLNKMKWGDRNTKKFHRKATWRAKKNNISAIKRRDGSLSQDMDEIKGITNDFFKNLYSCVYVVNPSRIISLMKPLVTDQMNEDLCKPFSEQEISDALFQIGTLKAPGPDGFPARFFQRNWGLLKEDIVRAIQHFFISGTMPEGINDTTIVLIPKVKNPQSIKDFRPISLCNVIYKIISKCLVNRLRPMLDGMIYPTQSAFIPGRSISDNALIAFECMHSLNTLKDSSVEFCAYKLDLAKAYDRVDWEFLESMLQVYGFFSNMD